MRNIRPSIEPYFPHYQPLVYLPSGNIAGYEMLARTRNPRGEIISAGNLFSDPALPVDFKIAVDRQLRQTGFNHFAGHDDCGFITVNITPDWVNRLGDDIASPTMKMIDAAGLDPSRVVIEITETAGELTRLQRIVKEYHRGGVRVAIDDFGAGNSQLDRIIALAPDIIKLDMRLFKLAARGGLSADVLLGMMSITERAGFEVVCEGVETLDEFCFGVDCGASYMQGYLFAPAMPTPLAENQFKPQIDELIGQYFQRKTARLGLSIEHSRAIKQAVLKLREQLRQGVAADAVAIESLHQLGIMRFFICNTQGEQLSPNYQISAGGVQLDPRYLGYNWSWRPYFPTLMAMRDRIEFDLMASTTYRDATTNRLCKTFGAFLDEQRVLLVDAAVTDDVLFAGN